MSSVIIIIIIIITVSEKWIPRAVVRVTAQSFEIGSDIYTRDRGIVPGYSVVYGMSFEIPLTYSFPFAWSR